MEGIAERIEEELDLVVPVQKLSLECTSCGYGVSRSTPPERCPMCQSADAWVHTPWRPFGRRPSH
jgi:rubrerythrin